MFQRSIRPLAATLTLAVAFCLGFTEGKTTAERYTKLYRKAHAKADRERWDKVIKIAGKLERLAPDATRHLSLFTEAWIGSGDHDAAFAAIERSIEAGWTDVDGLDGWKEIEPLRDDPRYAALNERAAESGRAWEERQRTRHRVLPLEQAESFDSAESLVAAFEARRDEHGSSSILRPYVENVAGESAINDAEIAAAWRYVADHPDAEDADEAGVAAVRAANGYKKWWAFMDGDAAIVIDSADRFLERWPDSEFRPEVELSRAIAVWKSYGEDEDEATLVQRSVEADPLFEAIGDHHPGTAEATKASIWRLAIATERSAGELTREIEELYAALEPTFEEDDELRQYAWSTAPRAMFQINGRELFDGTDLDGNRWTWETMQGKVVLIDFWATWCGPCVADIPHIRETYGKYKDAGFTVVGVSLDDGDEETFLKECEELGVAWPQIYDGEGWNSPLARRFGISGIPMPVLVDRDGKVVGVESQVRGEKLMEQVAGLLDTE